MHGYVLSGFHVQFFAECFQTRQQLSAALKGRVGLDLHERCTAVFHVQVAEAVVVAEFDCVKNSAERRIFLFLPARRAVEHSHAGISLCEQRACVAEEEISFTLSAFSIFSWKRFIRQRPVAGTGLVDNGNIRKNLPDLPHQFGAGVRAADSNPGSVRGLKLFF